eukprot:1902105-Pyramimonas_sp.AAC.1
MLFRPITSDLTIPTILIPTCVYSRLAYLTESRTLLCLEDSSSCIDRLWEQSTLTWAQMTKTPLLLAVRCERAFTIHAGRRDSERKPPLTYQDLILRIELPGTNSMAELDLDVQATYVRLESPLYRLAVYLPHKVDEERGTAKWDKVKEVLNVYLPIVRKHIVDALAEACGAEVQD